MSTFNNFATLSYSGNTVASNTVTGEVLDEINANKSANITEYIHGTQTTFAINIVNDTEEAYTGIEISDNLGEGEYDAGTTIFPLTYVPDSAAFILDGAEAVPLAVTSTSPLVISGLEVPAGSTMTILYSAEVNNTAPITGDGITNTATINGDSIDAQSVETTITPNANPILTIEKAIDKTPVEKDDYITYTFTIRNYSGYPADAETSNPKVRDEFERILTDVTATFDGTAWENYNQFNYSEETGVFETNDGKIEIPAAEVVRDAVTQEVTIIPSEKVLTIRGKV